jgi:hypothetical protein
VLADAAPPGFAAVAPDLEDVYFGQLLGTLDGARAPTAA